MKNILNPTVMKREESRNLIVKGIFITLTMLAMQIPAALVNVAVSDREELSEKVVDEVSASWGGVQTVSVPEFVVPYVEKRADDYSGETVVYEQRLSAIPETADVSGEVSVEMLHRGIYDIPAWKADLTFRGKIGLDAQTVSFAKKEGCGYLAFDISHRQGIEGKIVLEIDGTEYALEPFRDELRTRIPVESLMPDKTMEYVMKLTLKGIESINFIPDAESYNLELRSDYASPSFTGAFLPSDREVTDNGFEASWSVNEMNMYNLDGEASMFGVDFYVPVSMYRQTDRALKYSFLVILLIFMGIFMTERFCGKNVNMVQYIVTGLSLCLFYLLLLAFTEYMPFALAYSSASLLTVCALGAYFRAILKSRAGYWFAAAVAVLYAFIYLLLTIESGSLLIGTLALFLVLCIIMYFTRNLNKDGE